MGIAIPFVGILLILGTLLLFGIAWMFHHHFWKPVVGGLLFVVGVAVLVMFGWSMPRRAAMNEGFPHRSVDRDPDGASLDVGDDEAAMRRHGDAGHLEQTSKSATVAATAERSTSKPATDSAAPPDTSSPAAASGHPAWVDRTPGLKAAGKGYEATVASEFYSTRPECKRAIIPRVNELVDEYISENYPDATEQGANLDRNYIWSKLVKAEYWETVDKTFGTETHPMNQLHVLLAFDTQVGRDLAEQARQALIETRLEQAAGIVACSLAVLGGLFVLLKRGATPRAPTPEHVA
jgi:hypothetical protein